jgi:hypothetical protein
MHSSASGAFPTPVPKFLPAPQLPLCFAVLKMDVEGFEATVLDGAEQFFASRNVWYLIQEVLESMIGEEVCVICMAPRGTYLAVGAL